MRIFRHALVPALAALGTASVALGQSPYNAGPASPYPHTAWNDYVATPQAPPGYSYGRMASADELPTPPAAGPPSTYLQEHAEQYGVESAYDAAGYGCEPACAPAVDAYCCPPAAMWGGSVGVLFLTRDAGSHYRFSYDDADESAQFTDYRDTSFNWAPGMEARLTRFDCCCQTGLEIVYWQLFPDNEQATTLGTDVVGNLNGILNWDQLDYNGGSADASVNNAAAHRVSSDVDIYNVEFNRILVHGGRGPLAFHSVAGVRIFKIDENLQFASDPTDTVFDGAADELYYNIKTQNTLVGFQIGGFSEYAWSDRMSVVLGAKAGAFGNIAEANSRIGGAAGTATINNGPNNGRAWDVETNKTDLAVLAELIAGVNYRVGANWRLGAEYRVIGVSGLALPTNQIYADLRGLQDVELLSTDGNLLLHGVFLRAERRF